MCYHALHDMCLAYGAGPEQGLCYFHSWGRAENWAIFRCQFRGRASAKKKHRDCWVYARRRQTTMQGSFHTDADRGLAFAVPVDLVLVHHGSLACMLACPRCDTVNVHSLGYTHSAVWGHRACNAREATCAGYILRLAPVICKVSTPEWRRRVRGLIQQEKRQICRGRSPNTDNVKK